MTDPGSPSDHITPYDRLALDERVMIALLAAPVPSEGLVEYFGAELHAELAVLARRTIEKPPGPQARRVYVLPGIMGSQLGFARGGGKPNDILWLDPIDFQLGRLTDLRFGPGSRVIALGAMNYTYLKLTLSLRAAGFDAVLLDYDWRRDVATLGKQLADRVVADGREDVALVGHSMGGLVARSAIHHGLLVQRGRLRWPARVADLVCLGTPHQGAPLERAGHGIDLLLGAVPHAARLAGLRSAGINDLRLGNVVPGPASDDGTFRCEQVGLPAGTRCFAIAGCLGSAGAGLEADLQGDGLVPVASALGHHDQPERRLDFAPDRQAVVDRTNHLDLLSSAKVHGLLRQWLR